jgi:hypothetical protein
MVAFSALGALAIALIPYDYIATEYTWAEDPGEYPENGSQEEQDGWNESKESWDLQQLTQNLLFEMEDEVPMQLTLFGGVTLVGVAAMILLARQNPNGFNLAYVWLFLSTCSNIYSTIRYNSLMSDLDQFFPEESMSGTYQVAASIGGTLACNLLLPSFNRRLKVELLTRPSVVYATTSQYPVLQHRNNSRHDHHSDDGRRYWVHGSSEECLQRHRRRTEKYGRWGVEGIH